MQPKTIKSVIKKKITEWIASIKDSDLREKIKTDAIVTGGAITSLLMGSVPNDYDVYFRTIETCEAVARYYVKMFLENPPSKFKKDKGEAEITVLRESDRVKIVVKSQGIAGESGTDNYQYFEQPNIDPSEPAEFVESVVADKKESESKEKIKYRPVFLTSNAITLSDQIQIVIRFFGEVKEIHKNFDFVHCTCSWDLASGSLILPSEALIAILNKRLKYKTSKYPLCSLIRTRKFLRVGWTIDAGQYVKMAWDLNKLNLSDIKVLEDQMIGVDSAYFAEAIALLSQMTDGGAKPVEDSYIIEIIDRIFG